MKRLILLAAVLAAGCSRALTPPVTVSAKAPAARIDTLAVMPVEASSTTTGNAAARAPAAVTEMMTAAAAAHGTWSLVDPDTVAAALEGIDAAQPIEVRAGALASRLGADAVLTATVARYWERRGQSYGVSAPASVSIQFLAVRAGERSADWKADYTVTQEPLAYNLWNAWGFVRTGAKWLTADELARLGVEEAVKRLAERSGGS